VRKTSDLEAHISAQSCRYHCRSCSPQEPRNVAPSEGVEVLLEKEGQMHKDEVKGKGKEARGHAKDAIGKATGDEKLRNDGAADKVEGGIQKNVGKAKEAVRDALKK
jgi:uncharacterized protein YjbJ (UPF0337 family)